MLLAYCYRWGVPSLLGRGFIPWWGGPGQVRDSLIALSLRSQVYQKYPVRMLCLAAERG